MKSTYTEKKGLIGESGLCARKVVFTVLALCVLMCPEIVKSQVTPFHYWTFDNATSPLRDDMSSGSLNPSYYQCVYSITLSGTGSAGRSLTLDNTTGRAIVATGTLIPDSILTIEFMFKSAPGFNLTEFVRRRDGAFNVRIGYPF